MVNPIVREVPQYDAEWKTYGDMHKVLKAAGFDGCRSWRHTSMHGDDALHKLRERKFDFGTLPFACITTALIMLGTWGLVYGLGNGGPVQNCIPEFLIATEALAGVGLLIGIGYAYYAGKEQRHLSSLLSKEQAEKVLQTLSDKVAKESKEIKELLGKIENGPTFDPEWKTYGDWHRAVRQMKHPSKAHWYAADQKEAKYQGIASLSTQVMLACLFAGIWVTSMTRFNFSTPGARLLGYTVLGVCGTPIVLGAGGLAWSVTKEKKHLKRELPEQEGEWMMQKMQVSYVREQQRRGVIS